MSTLKPAQILTPPLTEGLVTRAQGQSVDCLSIAEEHRRRYGVDIYGLYDHQNDHELVHQISPESRFEMHLDWLNRHVPSYGSEPIVCTRLKALNQVRPDAVTLEHEEELRAILGLISDRHMMFRLKVPIFPCDECVVLRKRFGLPSN